MASPSDLPSNVHVSTHPCLQAKLSQLRSASASPREVKALVHEISLILGCEALASNLKSAPGPKVRRDTSLVLVVRRVFGSFRADLGFCRIKLP